MSTITDEESKYIIESLKNDGYVIIPNILSEKEIETATQMFEDWQKSIPNLEYLHKTVDPHGIYKYHEAGHQRHAWYLRTKPKTTAQKFTVEPEKKAPQENALPCDSCSG